MFENFDGDAALQFDEEQPLALALAADPTHCFECPEPGLEDNFHLHMDAIPARIPAIELAPGQVDVAVSHVNEHEKQQVKFASTLELPAPQEEEEKKNEHEKQQVEDKPPEEQEDEGMPPLKDAAPTGAAPTGAAPTGAPPTDASLVLAGEADAHEQPGSMAVKHALYKNTMNQSKSNFWFHCFNGNVFAPHITTGAVVVAIIFFLLYGGYTGTSTDTKTALAKTVVTTVPRVLIAAVNGNEFYQVSPKICPDSEIALKTDKGSWHCATLKNSPKVHDEIEGQYLEMGAMWDLSHNFTHAIYRELYKWRNTKLTKYQIGTMLGTALVTGKYLPAQLLKMNKFTLGCTFCAWLAGAMYDVFDNHGPNPKCGLKLQQQ